MSLDLKPGDLLELTGWGDSEPEAVFVYAAEHRQLITIDSDGKFFIYRVISEDVAPDGAFTLTNAQANDPTGLNDETMTARKVGVLIES